jgi:glycerophosphoryl diester phosphodiesterase
MNSRHLALGAVFGLLAQLLGCASPEVSPIPAFADGGLLRLGPPLPQASHVPLEGRYRVNAGTDLLGEDVVLTTGKNTITLASGKEAAVVALQAACLSDDRLILEGHWRYPRGHEVGLVRLKLDDPKAARELCAGEETARLLRFTGMWGEGSEALEFSLQLTYEEPLIPYRGRFFSISHHGACEPADTCGVSANSLQTILLAERYGATAMEVDVRATKDGVPVLFHDPGFNSSTTRGIFCQGPIDSQTLDQIQANCRLAHGERIPTLEQGLDVLLDETLMDFAYLDVKVPEALARTAEIAAAINERADATGRKFRAVVALTTTDVTDAWRDFTANAKAVPPCLMEYDPDLVVELGCVAWGPQWTMGPRAEDVAKVRAAGARVVYWTLNDDNFIEAFLRSTHPDGAITARTGLLMYLYQKVGQVPPPVGGEPETP